jgi:hypothetical protein
MANYYFLRSSVSTGGLTGDVTGDVVGLVQVPTSELPAASAANAGQICHVRIMVR